MGVPRRIELTSFQGSPLTRIAQTTWGSFLFHPFSLWSLDRPFSDFGPTTGPKLIPKSIQSGAKVHSQGPPEKNPTRSSDVIHFPVYYPKG
jgi:hypothetical protein